MKIVDVARKDLLRSVRSVSFVGFGLFVPLLVTGIFYLAFGGVASGDEKLRVAVTKVLVVDLDEGDPQAGSFSAGRTLVGILASDELAALLEVTEATDPSAVRAAVDRQEAGVAVIIPPGLTAAAYRPDSSVTAAIEMYQDPTLTLGPGIVRSVISQYVDTFTGSRIAAGLVATLPGGAPDPGLVQAAAAQYARWATTTSQERSRGRDPLLETRAPAAAAQPAGDLRTTILSSVMAGMMAFYLFFTGAASAQSLLEEQETGTLSRLFTTPTRHSAILGGRLLATYATLIVQGVVLLVLSRLIFGIRWGRVPAIGVVTLGVVVLAASFGLFVTSLLKDSRQGGLVYGGVMTLMGMVGMMGVFSANVPNASQGAFKIVPLFVPQGWAVRGWELLLEGGSVLDVLPTTGVMLAAGLLFFVIGLLRFRRRFA